MKELVDKPRPSRLRWLSDEEIALWIEVAKTVVRRRGATLPTLAAPRAPEPAAPPATAPPPPGAEASARRAEASRLPPLAPLDRRLKRALAHGRLEVDAALDLHGMTQSEAHHALRAFILGAQARGMRLAIVVTGKGAARLRPGVADFGDEPGVLRRLVPHWLRAPDLRSAVLGFEEAGPAHGGAGALYVRLRRREKR
jgi:DNA-nicking Smr family endonuclease